MFVLFFRIESINAECICCDASEFESNNVQSTSEVTSLNSVSNFHPMKCFLMNSYIFQIKLLGVEYSGRNEVGEKIMGLASTFSSHPVAKMDPILQWKVPDGWELTEAVTVPVVYAHVIIMTFYPKQYITSR